MMLSLNHTPAETVPYTGVIKDAIPTGHTALDRYTRSASAVSAPVCAFTVICAS